MHPVAVEIDRKNVGARNCDERNIEAVASRERGE
jgi:hypothetical protein